MCLELEDSFWLMFDSADDVGLFMAEIEVQMCYR